MVEFKIGCCGFPGGMESYFKRFNVAEVQTTFYNLPRVETVRKWRQKAPESFEFTVKAWQGLTHPPGMPTWRRTRIQVPADAISRYGMLRPTPEVFEAWERTRLVCEALKAKICLIQCPARFQASEENIDNMKKLLTRIERGNLTIAWEPRGESWEEEQVRRLCSELNLIPCIDPFKISIPPGQRIIYLRLHGRVNGGVRYRYTYTKQELEELYINIQTQSPEIAYCLFNNITMRQDAEKLKQIIKHRA
ncbi:MAG: DUF72 domain-containing protein [Candidatus Bathyarchaeia archaeon]